MGAITFDFGELAVDVIAHPNVEHEVHDQQNREQNDDEPKKFTAINPFHFPQKNTTHGTALRSNF